MRELPSVAGATERMLALHARDPERYPGPARQRRDRRRRSAGSACCMAAPGERLILDRDARLDGPGLGHAVLRAPERVVAGNRADRPRRSPGHSPAAGSCISATNWRRKSSRRCGCRRRRCRSSPWPGACARRSCTTTRVAAASSPASLARRPMPSAWRPISSARAESSSNPTAVSATALDGGRSGALPRGLPSRAGPHCGG